MNPGWASGIAGMLNDLQDRLRVVDIRNRDRLEEACQTGFVWTRRPGVVCLAVNRHYFRLASGNPDVAVIIAPPEVVEREAEQDKAVVATTDPDGLYHYLHMAQAFEDAGTGPRIHDTAEIHDSAVLRGQVTVEEGVRIGPRAVIDGPIHIARGVVIESGAIVGCEGLYAKTVLGKRCHIPHFGGIDIGENAYIYAGAILVRSAIRGECTRIGERAHIGIRSTIGHDAMIDDEVTISSNVLVAGRARIGARAWIGASATISNTIAVGEDSKVRIGAVVVRDVPAGSDVSGNLARDHKKVMRKYMNEVRSEH
jgi:UDP-3-O-[3-hydroxymyristoyl] glucosamine N-acyltransferase